MIGLVGRLGRRLGVHAYRVLCRPLSRVQIAPPAGIVLRPLEEREMLERCANPQQLELSPQKSAAAFSRGEVCIGAMDGGRLVGYAWFAFRPAPHVNRIWMDFDPRVIYTYRAFVHPGYRGRRIAPALYCFADGLFLDRGRTFAALCIELDNAPSLIAARRSGARTVGFVAYLHAGGRFLSLRTRGARKIGYRFYVPQSAEEQRYERRNAS